MLVTAERAVDAILDVAERLVDLLLRVLTEAGRKELRGHALLRHEAAMGLRVHHSVGVRRVLRVVVCTGRGLRSWRSRGGGCLRGGSSAEALLGREGGISRVLLKVVESIGHSTTKVLRRGEYAGCGGGCGGWGGTGGGVVTVVVEVE